MQQVEDITGAVLTPGKPDSCEGNGATPDGSGGVK